MLEERQKTMGLFSSLNREQKEAIGLLQIGTFLEYFDLMLYIHMAVVLNETFFPQTDTHTASLLAAFTFCITFVFRPIGALIFGWIGDHIGRKTTIIISTIMMSVSCIVMANLPTYAQIGISAAWIMTFCRVAQGMSSIGEIYGGQIYLAESVKRPASYPVVAFLVVAAEIGGMVALGIATLATSYSLNWRAAFWVGAVIAIVGAIARTRLRETPDFLKLKDQRRRRVVAELNEDEGGNSTTQSQLDIPEWKQHVSSKTLLSFFFILCGYPLIFYLSFMYFNPILRDIFGYSPADIILHNFFLAIVGAISYIFWVLLSTRIHPIKIIKIRALFFLCFMIVMPFLIITTPNIGFIFFIQALALMFPLDGTPAEAVFIYHLPLYRRFTYATFINTLARALMYIIISFGLIYLGDYFGTFGLWFITLPLAVAFLYGVLHFEKLERKLEIYPKLSIDETE
jgi:MHS family proline/betaine transporter-like MFS transporter